MCGKRPEAAVSFGNVRRHLLILPQEHSRDTLCLQAGWGFFCAQTNVLSKSDHQQFSCIPTTTPLTYSQMFYIHPWKSGLLE